MPAAPLSPFREFGGLIFTSGQIGFESDGSISPKLGRQMEQTMAALTTQLESAGASLSTVLKATVFITDPASFDEMNEIYSRHFAEPYPARTTLVTELALPELLVEIEVVARKRDE
jgi:2-iminobutanoate/2-iminopropanoate deaminase